MTPEREKELRECMGIWCEGGESTATEILDAVASMREKVVRLEFMIKEGLGYEDLINDI